MTNIKTLKSQQVEYISRLVQRYNSTKNESIVSAEKLTKNLMSMIDAIDAINSDLNKIKILLNQDNNLSKFTFNNNSEKKLRELLGQVCENYTHPAFTNIPKLFINNAYNSTAHKQIVKSFFKTFIELSNRGTSSAYEHYKKNFPSIMKNVSFDEMKNIVQDIEKLINKQKAAINTVKSDLQSNIGNISTDKVILSTVAMRKITRHNEIIASVNMPEVGGNLLLAFSSQPVFEIKKTLNYIHIKGDYRGDICITDGSTHENSAQINGVAQGGQKILSYNQYKDGIAFSGSSDIFYVSAVSHQQGYEIHKDTQFLAIK